MTAALDDAFETRLRTSLADLRPSGGAPDGLRSRIVGIPERIGRTGLIGKLQGARRPLAVTAGVAALASIALLAITFTPIGRPNPGNVGAGAESLDPTAEGIGRVTWIVPALPIAEWALAGGLIVAALLAWRAYRRTDRWRWLAGAALGAAVAVGLGWLSLVQGVGNGGWNGYGPVLGLVPPLNASQGGTDTSPQTLQVDVGPGEPFVLVFVAQNTGPIAVRLEGIVEDPDAEHVIRPRWTALALGTNANAIGQPVDELVPFHPIELAPGQDVTLYVVGKASQCAAGPGATEESGASAWLGPQIELAYSVFGLVATHGYLMPMQIAEPLVVPCPS